MPSQTLLISRYFVKSGQADALATKLGDNDASRIFISLDESEVLELRALEANQYKGRTQPLLLPLFHRSRPTNA